MKKLIISLVISAPLFLIAPGFAASSSILYNPELRTDTFNSAGYNTLPKGGGYAYYWHHHRHWHHGWHKRVLA